nr:hypothetical protein [Pseudomonadales bacterium]
MTAQIPEVLRFESREHPMCTEPLEDYFELGGRKSPFASYCTANWRGYIGTWEVRGQRLYLVGLEGRSGEGAELTLVSLFPGHGSRVYAHWYSGTVRLPEGKLLKYFHGGYGSTYERDRLLRFDKGVLVETSVQRNGEAAGDDAEGEDEGYVVAAMTHFPPPETRANPLP